tara:strand:+ start:1078 stop:1560 length:483 start_codon:yes stop_codon:yes gene_type:complete
MIVDFQNMPDDSRIWTYQSDRDLLESEIAIINDKASSFLNTWQAHGKDLECSYSIINKRFIVIAVNENVNPIGGCSIDYSLQLINDISESINLNLLNRLVVNYIKDNKISSVSLNDLKKKIKDGTFSSETIIFNTAISKKAELLDNFEIKIRSSWLSKFL